VNKAYGDGCFFRAKKVPVGNSAESPHQRAFILFDQNRETLIVQVKFQGEATDFSWIVPVPAIPEDGSIKTVSDSIFTLLHEQTQPKLFIHSKGKYGEGRGLPETDNLNNEIYEATAINVWQNLQVDPYKIYVISSLSNHRRL